MRTILFIFLLFITQLAWAQVEKPRIFNGTVWIEFNTVAEFNTYIQSLAQPQPPEVVELLKQAKREELAKDLLKEIWKGFNDLQITDADKVTLMQTISPVLLGISVGFFNASKSYAQTIPTNSVYTAGRKNALVAMIDNYITLSNQ